MSGPSSRMSGPSSRLWTGFSHSLRPRKVSFTRRSGPPGVQKDKRLFCLVLAPLLSLLCCVCLLLLLLKNISRALAGLPTEQIHCTFTRQERRRCVMSFFKAIGGFFFGGSAAAKADERRGVLEDFPESPQHGAKPPPAVSPAVSLVPVPAAGKRSSSVQISETMTVQVSVFRSGCYRS